MTEQNIEIDVGMFIKETKENLAKRIASKEFLKEFKAHMKTKPHEPEDYDHEEVVRFFQEFILLKFG